MKTKISFIVALFFACSSSLMALSFTYSYLGIDFKCKVYYDIATITSFNKDAAKVFIPAEVTNPKNNKTYAVSTVDLYDEGIVYKTTSVALEKGITTISDNCFQNFKDLQQIYIPSSVVVIEKKAFNSKRLPKFTMPSSINEDDLSKGLAIYPKTTEVEYDPMKDIDLADYIDDDSSVPTNTDVVEQNEIVSIEAKPGTSDIDFNIPRTNEKRENTFCIIIANENYVNKDTPKVKYAAQDGKTFYDYCSKTLGLPRENIKMLTNATYLKMKDQLKWLEKIANLYGNDANFIVYYAGHGVPDEKGNCKLVPVDVSINDVENGYSLKELYNLLGKITTKSALVLVDACFSGNDRGDTWAMNEEHRGITRKLKQESIGGNVVVMTAASNTETALAYNEKAHGLFSYFLMKKLQETKGNVTYGELFDYINKEVLRKSTVAMDKTQTPSVSYSSKIASTWKQLKF